MALIYSTTQTDNGNCYSIDFIYHDFCC